MISLLSNVACPALWETLARVLGQRLWCEPEHLSIWIRTALTWKRSILGWFQPLTTTTGRGCCLCRLWASLRSLLIVRLILLSTVPSEMWSGVPRRAVGMAWSMGFIKGVVETNHRRNGPSSLINSPRVMPKRVTFVRPPVPRGWRYLWLWNKEYRDRPLDSLCLLTWEVFLSSEYGL